MDKDNIKTWKKPFIFHFTEIAQVLICPCNNYSIITNKYIFIKN